jgi:hypothetical protein
MQTPELTPKDFVAVKSLECKDCYFFNVKCFNHACEMVNKLDKIHGQCSKEDHVYQLKTTQNDSERAI